MKRSLVLLVLFCCLVRLVFLYQVQTARKVPIELDDAYSYLIKAAILEKDVHYASPALQSFEKLTCPMVLTRGPDEYQERLYHRMKNIYHVGHSYLLLIVKKISGLSYLSLWWGFTYFFNVALIVAVAFFVYMIFGAPLTHLVLGFYALSFIPVQHQITAAPREWSVLGAILTLIALFLLAKEQTPPKRKVGLLWAFFAVSLFFCITAHDIGVVLIMQALAMGVVTILCLQPHQLKRFVTPMALITIAAFLVRVALLHYVRPDSGETSPTGVNFSRSAYSLLDGYLLIFSWPIVMVKFIPYLSKSIAVGLFAYTLVVLWKEQWTNPRSRIFLFLIASTMAAQAGFFFLGWRSINGAMIFFESYYVTFSFLIFSMVYAYGLLHMARKWVSRDWVYIVAFWLFLPGMLPFHLHMLEKVAHYYIERHPIPDPAEFVRQMDTVLDGQCMSLEGEISLYSYLLYGNLKTPIAFSGFCEDPERYQNMPGNKCAWTFLMKGQEVCNDVGSRRDKKIIPVLSDGNYILGKVIQ